MSRKWAGAAGAHAVSVALLLICVSKTWNAEIPFEGLFLVLLAQMEGYLCMNAFARSLERRSYDLI